MRGCLEALKPSWPCGDNGILDPVTVCKQLILVFLPKITSLTKINITRIYVLWGKRTRSRITIISTALQISCTGMSAFSSPWNSSQGPSNLRSLAKITMHQQSTSEVNIIKFQRNITRVTHLYVSSLASDSLSYSGPHKHVKHFWTMMRGLTLEHFLGLKFSKTFVFPYQFIQHFQ